MKIVYKNENDVKQVNSEWPRGIVCTHCSSLLEADKQDVVSVYSYNNEIFFIAKCPCCELLTDFG